MIRLAQSGYGVNWNQLVYNGNFESSSGWSTLRGTINSITSGVVKFIATTTSPAFLYSSYAYRTVYTNHKYFLKVHIESSFTLQGCQFTYYQQEFAGSFNIVSGSNDYTLITNANTSTSSGWLGLKFPSFLNDYIYISNYIIIDLTDAFGSGNEPTSVEDFRSMYPDDYYPYVLSEWQYSKNNYITSYPTPVIENGTTLLPIESKTVGLIKPELSNISLIQLKSGSYKNSADDGPYVTVSDGNEITINTPSTDANYGVTTIPFVSAFTSAKTLKAGHTYYWFINGEKRSGDWNCIVVDYSNKHLDAYFLYTGNINTFTPETDVTITSVRVYLANSSKHYDNYKIKLIITENQQYLIDKGLISQ